MKEDGALSTVSTDSFVVNSERELDTISDNGSYPEYFVGVKRPKDDLATLSSAEKYKLEQELFYRSYDPSVGYNTATILAGLLIAILMYVFYRTKIRKPLIRFVKRKFKELTKRNKKTKFSDCEEVEEVERPINDEESSQSEEPKSEKTTNRGTESVKDSSVHQSLGKDKSMPDQVQCQFSIDEHTNLPTLTITDEDNKALPIVFMDIDAVTADWVHKQHQFLNPGGVIVKVKSDNIWPQNNELHPSKPKNSKVRLNQCTNPHCRLNVNDQVLCGAHSQNALNLCKSIPMFDSQGLTPLQAESSDKKSHRQANGRPRRFSSVASDSKASFSPHPLNPHNPVKTTKVHNSEHRTPLVKQSSVPVHITPIIKIQNFDKSRSNLNESRKKDSRESLSSSSSENPSLYTTPVDTRWHTNKHYPPLSRSMTEETPPPSRRPFSTVNHSPRLPHNIKQMSLEEACHLGLLVPVNRISQSSLSCQNMSHTEETTL
ncbi:hypothetical protein FSP39_006202 [Pinctada imbricata]|uniref:Uncharacterized protein n=1 Tax=Pinctada imbricata TaxID=66713 RepID=A0AA88YDT5_PINIB|nr:hypothetical protein FSP39_006202 [Pinctada imbricata]